MLQALDVLQRHRDSTSPVFPRQEEVPLDGVVKDEWQDLVLDERHGGRVNWISYGSISIGSCVYTLVWRTS